MSSEDGLEVELAPGAPLDAAAARAAVAAHEAVVAAGGVADLDRPLIHRSRRTRITCVEAGGQTVIVKEYLPRATIERLFRGDPARTAFGVGIEGGARGAPLPAAIALVRRPADKHAFVVMERFGGGSATQLHHFLARYEDARIGSPRARARAALARAVGAFLAALHRAGLDPSDLAAQNVLARERPGAGGDAAPAFDVVLVDWDGVKLRDAIPHRRRVRHLTHLADLPEHVPARDRLRALRAYRRAGGGAVSRADVRAVARGVAERKAAKAERARRRAAAAEREGGR